MNQMTPCSKSLPVAKAVPAVAALMIFWIASNASAEPLVECREGRFGGFICFSESSIANKLNLDDEWIIPKLEDWHEHSTESFTPKDENWD